MSAMEPPNCEQLRTTRDACEKHITQFRHCKQCRADAVGVPGFEKKDVACPTEYFHF
jgi:nitrogen fixation protein NifB